MKIRGFQNNPLKDGGWVRVTVGACIVVLVYTVFNNLPAIAGAIKSFFSLISPVLIGIAIAYLMTPLVKLIDRPLRRAIKNEHISNNVAVAIASALILLLLTLLMMSLIPQIIESIMQFVNNLNLYAEAARKVIVDITAALSSHNLDMNRVTEVFNQIIENIVVFITRNARTLLNQSFSYGRILGNLLIGIILALYFLVSKSAILQGFDKLLRNLFQREDYLSLRQFLGKCNKIFTEFVVNDLIDAMIVAIVNFIFMTALGMPYTVLISVVVGITNLAPTFGPFVGAFIGALILFFADARQTLIFLAFTLILQLFDGYVLKPRLFGNSMGVPGVWVTLGIIVGGKFFGVIGILLSVPVVGIITFMYREFMDRREQENAEKLAEAAQDGSTESLQAVREKDGRAGERV